MSWLSAVNINNWYISHTLICFTTFNSKSITPINVHLIKNSIEHYFQRTNK